MVVLRSGKTTKEFAKKKKYKRIKAADLIANYVPGYTYCSNLLNPIEKLLICENIYKHLYPYDHLFIYNNYTFTWYWMNSNVKVWFLREDMCKLLHKCMSLEEWNLYHVIINYL